MAFLERIKKIKLCFKQKLERKEDAESQMSVEYGRFSRLTSLHQRTLYVQVMEKL